MPRRLFGRRSSVVRLPATDLQATMRAPKANSYKPPATPMATRPSTAAGLTSRRDLANALRALAMDAVQQANSGHPGMPMGMADIAEVVWNDFLKHNPHNPRWADRDRFLLSNGHGSMLLYGLLHLSGYSLGMDELRNFRQLGSRTAGHPERDLDIGIETTTGPLGQGISNAVGMALAEKLLADQFNQPGFEVVDHWTWAFLGDGCLMEGISHEACSLAGTLGLGKLICLYDDNGISIDGDVKGWFADDTPLRFRAYGWHVVSGVDGHDPVAIRSAIEDARANADQPSLICCRTVIGYGAPTLQGSAATHGAPLGEDEVAAARQELDWPHEPFEIPAEIRAGWDAGDQGMQREAAWRTQLDAYRSAHPELAAQLERRMAGELPPSWAVDAAEALESLKAETQAKATRKASLDALNVFAPILPELVGGSADLTGSNCTLHQGSVPITPGSAGGNYLYFGVREFGMAAVMNGLALHGGFIPYGGTFLTFSDYARNALRMAALMDQGSIFVFTHDSIGLGEDGPTHQPIEHIASLRLMPNMRVWRPCDVMETGMAWRDAIEHRAGPTSLVLTRQSLPQQPRSDQQISDIRRGGYILRGEGHPELILIATGSEVPLATAAADLLEAEGRKVRVVSMPCVSLFKSQDDAWKETVLPADVSARVVIEAGVAAGWLSMAGPGGAVISIDDFGESAPGPELFKHFGFTPEQVAETARQILNR